MRLARQFLILIRKDLLLEIRGGELLTLLVALALLLSLMISFAFKIALLSPVEISRLFPLSVWLVFIFTATVSIGRSFASEVEESALDGVLLSGVDLAVVYLSKVTSNLILILIGHLVGTVFLGVLLDVSWHSQLGPYFLISLLILLGYSLLSVLFFGIAAASRLQQLLLPLVLLPLLLPLFMAAIELTTGVLQGRALDFSSGWLSLLLGLDLIYLLLGINLFSFTVRR